MTRTTAILAFAILAMAAGCSTRSTTVPVDAAPAIPREMRGIWIATVRNIDWPSKDTLAAQAQRAELIDIYDRAVAAGFNTVVFQVRPATDAVYRSDLEPWSVLLTGRQGTDPGYDPLEFAVREAHARGLEIHAWINPFRAGNASDTSVLASTHQWNSRRALVRVYGAQLWLDPGEPEAREHSLRVVSDIVRRYDLDGIHMDDYFYPYPVRDSVRGGNLVFPDSASFAKSGSSLSIDDWRRENIDRFVERMYRTAHEIKPHIKVGISPFGIWRPGNPPSVAGFDAYASIYADARKWLQSGWVDYFVPQLYWAISAPQQSFPALLDWWLSENTMRRYVWPGLATYRASAQTNGFSRTEIAEQVKIIRSRMPTPGHVMFNTTTTLKRDNGVLGTLRPLLEQRALVPAFTWLDSTPPPAPTLSVTGRAVQITAGERPRFLVLQTQSRGGLLRRARWSTRIVSGDSTSLTLPEDAARAYVTAVDHAGNLSPRQQVPASGQTARQPRIIPGEQWRATPALGYAADATRRNTSAGDSLSFRDFTITVLATNVDSSGARPVDNVRLRLRQGAVTEERSAREGAAFNWNGYHIAVVAIYGPGELGAGLVALEVATIASLPPLVAASTAAGGADMRLRIPHRITHITLHHTGSAEPLRRDENPVDKLRGLQSWGAAERNWWDVPYHYLLDLDGRIFAGRDWGYMGETNATYDPGGHFLISMIGNYERQEPSPTQLAAIADLMAWAITEFSLPLERIGGHYNYASTGCPGQHLRKYLEDGTLRRMVGERLR
jgi:uncharacterized lipoprotein YddW (UPF0748 family)